jgi:peptidoglycan/LPS O-acetylase OafA/YrhL
LDTLTGIRGIASMLVYFVHAGMEPVFRQSQINDTMVHLGAGLGEAAVSFFFMLSGFVLVWASRPGDTPRAFWRRRAVKILPNTVVTWTAGLGLMILAGEFAGLWPLLPSLALIHVWIPIESVIAGTDGPAWSLSVEAFFYALFPLALLVVRRIRADRLWRWLFTSAALLAVITLIVAFAVPSEPKALGQDVSLYQFYLLIFLPPVRLIDFVLGMLICRIVTEKLWPDVSWAWIAGALAAGWAFSVVLPRPLGFVVPLIAANVLLIGKAATLDISHTPSFFTRRSVVWLGDVSFAFYLIHWLVLHYGRVFLGGGPWSSPVATAFLVGCLALSLLLAEGLRRWVEMPMMRRYARPATRRDTSKSPNGALDPKMTASTPSVSADVQ